MSSTHFEWTIDEVSKILPAHVEPDESQFQNTPNPEMEARAQKAISTFFKENKIVPSPFNGSVQKCAASSVYKSSANTPEVKPGRRIRDCASQTMLSFAPTKLPPELEEMLSKYMLPELAEPESIDLPTHLACTAKIDYIKDTSLRRKLFDMQNIILLDSATDSPIISSQTDYQTISSPIKETHLCRKSKFKISTIPPLHGSIDTKRSTFGNLSPILNGNDNRSPLAINVNKSFERISGITDFFNGIDDQISPIRRE